MNLLDRISKYRQSDPEYGADLITALNAIGEVELEKMLDEAEQLGKRLELTYPIPFEVGPSEPNGVKIV